MGFMVSIHNEKYPDKELIGQLTSEKGNCLKASTRERTVKER